MKIVVVGGVAAGMSCAARARRLDEFAEIVVFERANHVSFANCGLPYHIGEVIKDRSRLLLQTPESLDESLAIDVRTAVEVTDIEPGSKSVRVRDLRSGQESVESYGTERLAQGRPAAPGEEHPGPRVLRHAALRPRPAPVVHHEHARRRPSADQEDHEGPPRAEPCLLYTSLSPRDGL